MKTVQIATTSPNDGNWPAIYALTDDGKLFVKILSQNDYTNWEQIAAPDEDDIIPDLED